MPEESRRQRRFRNAVVWWRRGAVLEISKLTGMADPVIRRQQAGGDACGSAAMGSEGVLRMALLEGEFGRAQVMLEVVRAELAAARSEIATRIAEGAKLEAARHAAEAQWQSRHNEVERLIGERDLLLSKLAQAETKVSASVNRAERLSRDLDAVQTEASRCAAECAGLKARLAEVDKLVAERDSLIVRTARAEIKAAASAQKRLHSSPVAETARNDIRALASLAGTSAHVAPGVARPQDTPSQTGVTAPLAAESFEWFAAAIAPIPEQIPRRRLSWLPRLQASRRVTVQLVRRRGNGSLMSRADRARDSRQWELAARYYRDALSQEPHNPAIAVQLGHALKESDRLAQAEAAYRYATQLTPRDHDPFLHLGHSLKQQKKITEAALAYQRALELCRDPAIAGQVRAEYSALGEPRT